MHRSPDTHLLGAAAAVLLVALAIKIDSPGPVLFRQTRRGFNDNLFEVLKFRTMYTEQSDADGAVHVLGSAVDDVLGEAERSVPRQRQTPSQEPGRPRDHGSLDAQCFECGVAAPEVEGVEHHVAVRE